MMKNSILLLAFCLFCGVLSSQNSSIITYRNPVIPGDFPDPTVIRVGEDYYAAGTTSDFAPNYPIYHSKDLINWERIGYVFFETPEWITGSCWAPELFYHNDTFFVYYTARKKSDNISCVGVATTKDIRAGFTDHGPLIEWGSEAIDAFVFQDTDGKLYITWKAYGLDNSRPIEILISELSPDGLSLVGEHFSLTKHDEGWLGRGDEGQVIVKHGEYYYHFYSVGGCCDNRCNYRVHVARAKDLRGSWEQLADPILEGGELWRCSGHGTLVQSPDGRYFYLYHAYHLYNFEFVGRQGLLDEMLWDEQTKWPYFKMGTNPSAQTAVPFEGTKQERKTLFFDDFSPNTVNHFWQWYMKIDKPTIQRTENGLVLAGNDNPEIYFYGINPFTGTYTMETRVTNFSNTWKGLSIYGNKDNWIGLGINGSEIQLYEMKAGQKNTIHTEKIENYEQVIYLKIESTVGRLFRVFWSLDQKEWQTFMQPNEHLDGSYIPRWGSGIHTGLLLENNSKDEGHFSWFKMNFTF
jgi:beta-xylosidase